MQDKPRRTILSLNHARVAAVLAILILSPSVFCEELTSSKRPVSAVVCRTQINLKRREEVAAKLRKITGWPDLKFDASGILGHGDRKATAGSKSARELLEKVMLGTNAVVLEDVSRHPGVAFMRVVPGQWKSFDGPPAFVVQIDFADFEQVLGDEEALAAFDVGWALLHELDHIANDSADAKSLGEAGECESRINEMRRECNLPLRIEYYYTASPLTQSTTFSTKLMRLAFEQSPAGSLKKRRYWIIWDANLVGGLEGESEVASLR